MSLAWASFVDSVHFGFRKYARWDRLFCTIWCYLLADSLESRPNIARVFVETLMFKDNIERYSRVLRDQRTESRPDRDYFETNVIP